MKTNIKAILMGVAAASFLFASSASASTIIIGNNGLGQNQTIPDSFGDDVSASEAGRFTVTDGGTPNIDLTWSAVDNGAGNNTTKWDFHNWGLAVTGDGGALQLNDSAGAASGGADSFIRNNVHQITFTPDTGYGVVINGFNFIGDTDPDTYQYDWRVVNDATSAVLASGQTVQWTTDDTDVGRPAWDGAPGVDISYIGAVGVALRLEVAQSIGSTGNAFNIAIDNLDFEQISATLPPVISSGSLAQAHSSAQAHDSGFVVSPYVQLAEPDSIYVVWQLGDRKQETVAVEYGLTDKLGQTQAAELVANQSNKEAIFQAKIEGLNPNTRYYYRVKTDAIHSAVYHFITPDVHQTEASLNILSTSDIQSGAPRFKSQIFPNGIKAWAEKRHNGYLAESFDLFMLPGDLVNRGNLPPEWHTFFDAMHPLLAHVPLYPAIGNHDGGGPIYLKYFVLPENGTPGHLERWYYKDYSNVRIITLDSNIKLGEPRHALQHAWLDELFKKTATEAHIDFVLLQLHHPHESELWIGGNHGFTGEVIKKAEAFSSSAGKPSMIVYGHTHGYSRGTSLDHGHVMVNVGGGGEYLDTWNKYLQNDYDRYQVSASEWGFAVIRTTAGEKPELRMEWHGTKDGKAFSINDSITLRKHNQPSAKPEIAQDVMSKDVPVEKMQLAMAGFSDPDNDALIESRWQIAEDAAFTTLVCDHFQARRNQYKGQDFNADLDLLSWQLPALPLEAGTRYYWRVRGRDAGLLWGPWSDAGEVSAAATQMTNVLDTARYWQLDEERNQGSFEYDSETDTLRFITKGTPVNKHGREWVKISKTLPLPADIQAGTARVYYGGTLSTSPLEANTRARACVWVEIVFLDKEGNRIGAAAPLSHERHVKKTMHKQVLIPPGTDSLLVEMTCGNNNPNGTVMIEAPYLKYAN